MSNAILEAALDMARRGFFILPVQPNSKEPFAWDINDPAKRNCSAKDRALAGSYKVATRDEAKIRSWFSHKLDPAFGYKGAQINYGISGIGMVIVDVDVKNGKAGLDDLLELGTLPRTFTVTSPSGGAHYYFSGAEAGQRKLTANIDIRSRGGYVVGPGSVIDGKSYEIFDDFTPALIPEHLYDRLGKPTDDRDKNQAPITELDTPLAIESAIAFLEREPPVPVGSRNNTAYIVACQVKDLGLSADKIGEVMIDHWNSKCDEPLPDEEIKAVAQNAFKSGRYAPGIRNPTDEFSDLVDLLKDLKPSSAKPRFNLIIQGRDPSEIPARPWLVPGLLLRSSLTALIAQPGARKSTFTVCVAVGFALGNLKWMGFDLNCGPTDVMMINNEDDEDEISRRVAAVCDLNGLDYADAMSRIHIYKSEDSSPFVGVGWNEKKSQIVPSEAYLELVGYVKIKKIGLVIIDPLADTHGCQENDNSEMAQVMSIYRKLARDCLVSGLIVHHSRKPDAASGANYAGDPFTTRGASAIHGNVRVLATLVSASEEDGHKLGLPPGKYIEYSRFDLGKGSYSPPGKHTRWYHCESRHVGPAESGDTAPSLTHFNGRDQASRMIVVIHDAVRQHQDLFDKEGKMSLSEAAEIVKDALPQTSIDDAEGYLRALFREPQMTDGVTLVLQKEGRKEFLSAR